MCMLVESMMMNSRTATATTTLPGVTSTATTNERARKRSLNENVNNNNNNNKVFELPVIGLKFATNFVGSSCGLQQQQHKRRKVIHITADLPQRLQQQQLQQQQQIIVPGSNTPASSAGIETTKYESPQTFLINMLSSEGYETMNINSMTKVPNAVTPDRIESYQHDVIELVRSRNIEHLRQRLERRECVNPCNRFGESLLHMACRRGFDDVATFYINEAKESSYIRDDYGRTPLHDVCWTVKPNFILLKLLIVKNPKLLFASDKRKHCPLDYVREEHWTVVKSFLQENKDDLFRNLPSSIAKSSSSK